MYRSKSQTRRIIDTYVTVIILVISITLILSGIVISKINTDYLENGIRAGKIVAERENTQISIINHNGVKLENNNFLYLNVIDRTLPFLPPPVNTSYLLVQEIQKIKIDKSEKLK